MFENRREQKWGRDKGRSGREGVYDDLLEMRKGDDSVTKPCAPNEVAGARSANPVKRLVLVIL
jgi:hypothetical protein